MNKTLKPGWSYKKLNELGFVGRGKSKHRPRNEPSLYGGKHPFIQTAEVTASEFYIIKYSQTYSDLGLAQSKLWDKNTLCIVNAGENTAETAILKFQACFPDSIIGFIADSEKADVRFIKYYLTTIKPQLRSITKGATQDNLSVSKLLLFDILTPPLPIQRKIAGILSAYDDLIENNTRRIEILEEMARSIYREWFVKFRFPGHEQVQMVDSELGLIPEGWEVKPIGEIINTVGGGTPSTTKPEYWDDGDIIWYVPKNLTAAKTMFIADSEKKITALGLQKSSARMFPAYSVMMTSRATIGVVAINTKLACTNQGFITCIPNEQLSAYQIYFWIIESLEKISNLASGSTFKEINKTTFRNLPIIIAEQIIRNNFVKLITPVCKQIENLQAKNTNLRQTRDLLLPRLISGEIDVENLDINTGEIAA